MTHPTMPDLSPDATAKADDWTGIVGWVILGWQAGRE